MEFDDVPFIFRMLLHWALCGALIWIGWENEDSFLLLMIIAAVGWVICFHNEIEQGHF
jgi:hypothetical protein